MFSSLAHVQTGLLRVGYIAGLDAFDVAENKPQSAKRAEIEFALEPPEAIKFVGRWFDVSTVRFSSPTASIGPVVPSLDPDRNRSDQIFTTSPFANTRHVLAISCVPIPCLGPDPEMLMFYGGLSSPEITIDLPKKSAFSPFSIQQ